MLLKGATLQDGRPISVFQTGWADIHVHASTYSSSGICVEICRLAASATMPGLQVGRRITIQPDFVLVRNEASLSNL
ncbi:unnamed protein product, partial [Symbiodinium pilosum]